MRFDGARLAFWRVRFRGSNGTHAPMRVSEDSDFSGTLVLRCPQSFLAAVKQAARQNMTSASSYMRSAALARLKADGCIPANDYGGSGE
jgi:hypothetical protein